MADDKTLQQKTGSTTDTLIIPKPNPGQITTITLESGQIPQLLFDPGTESTQEFVGNDLVFTMENGAILTFTDFATTINDGDVTSIMLEDGTVIPIEALMAAWELKVPEVAAGETTGAGEYRDDMGAALDGINKLGPQDPGTLPAATPQVLDDDQVAVLPEINIAPTIEGVGGIVYESGLENGSGMEPSVTVTEGTISIGDPNALDSIVSLSIDGEVLTIGTGPSEFNSLADMVGELFTLDHGTLELTGYTNGTFTYQYTLTSPTVDVEGVTETDSFVVTVSDGEFDVSTTIDIAIEDDLPNVSVSATGEAEIILTTQDAETDGIPTDSDSASTSADFSDVFSNVPVYGADGPGGTTWAYSLNLQGTDGGDSGLDSHGEDINLFNISGIIVGSTADTSEEVNADNTIFSISIDDTGVVTLTQDQQVDHIEGGEFDDYIGLSAGLVTLTGMATTIDSDGDIATDSQNIDLGGNLFFEDDGPVINSVMDAVLSSATEINFTGLYDADFGADGLDVMSVMLGSGGYVDGVPVSFEQLTPVDGVTKVNINDAEGTMFSFYYTTTGHPVSEGGDGSVVFDAFNDPNNPDDSQFFVLTVNGDGTYDFNIVSNTALTSTTVTGEDFSAFGPTGHVATLDESLIISGMDSDPGNDPDLVNASKQGIGVDNPNITIGEWVEMAFPKEDQSYVSFELQQWEGSGDSLVDITVDNMVFDDLVLSKPLGGDLFMEVVVTDDTELAGTWTANNNGSSYTLYVGDEFDSIRIDHTGDVDGNSSFNLNNITYDLETTIEDLTVNFTLSVTDFDGDSHTLSDDLTIAMVSPEDDITAIMGDIDTDGGVVLVGNGEDDVLTGGDGSDFLVGSHGNDTMTGDLGADTFIFNVGANDDGEDTITDFNLTEDTLSFYDVLDADADQNGINDYFDNIDIELTGPGDVDVVLHDNNSGTDITLEGVNSGGAFNGFVSLGDFMADDPAAINVESNPDSYAS